MYKQYRLQEAQNRLRMGCRTSRTDCKRSRIGSRTRKIGCRRSWIGFRGSRIDCRIYREEKAG